MIPFGLTGGDTQSCNVVFDQKAVDAGFVNGELEYTSGELVIPIPEGIRPDNYSATVKFITERCGDFTFPIDFTVQYPSSIIHQKWNDVLALKNSAYNGGNYTFSSYQWYKNGEPLSGATLPYLYIGRDGSEFDLLDSYSVRLVRNGEAVQLFSCPVSPVVKSSVYDYIQIATVASVGQKLMSSGLEPDITAVWFTVDGRAITRQAVGPDNITAPLIPGIYLLKLQRSDANFEVFKVVVTK